jgi:hypothetical protein
MEEDEAQLMEEKKPIAVQPTCLKPPCYVYARLKISEIKHTPFFHNR